MSTTNLYQRIISVMKEESIYIKKGSAGQGTGAQYDEVISVLAPLLTKHGIVVSVDKVGESRSRETKKGAYIYEGDFNVSYINIDNPEDRLVTLIESHAQDGGDKAPGKANTYATKTSMLKVFGIETGDKEESRVESANPLYITEDQQGQLYSLLCDDSGLFTPKGLKVCQAFKFQNLTDIKASKFDQILKAAK